MMKESATSTSTRTMLATRSQQDDDQHHAARTAAASWASIQWPVLLEQMNEQITVVFTQQRDQSSVTRKALIETSKQFKRAVKNVELLILGDEGEQQQRDNNNNNSGADTSSSDTRRVLLDAFNQECKSTLKGYKDEIDNLTRRCKAMEQGYTAVYMACHELPDPAVILQQVMQQNESLIAEVEYLKKMNDDKATKNDNNTGTTREQEDLIQQLRTEIAEYEAEFRGLKNQDITIRKLESKIEELQVQQEHDLQQAVSKAVDDIRVTEGRRVADGLERQALLEEQVLQLQLELQMERVHHDASTEDMLQVDEGSRRREASWDAQRQLLLNDNERLRDQLLSLQQQQQQSSHGVSSLMVSSPPVSGNLKMTSQEIALERKAYDAEVAELSETTKLLREELQAKNEQMMKANLESASKVDVLESQIQSLNSNLHSLELQLQAAPSQSLVDSMRRELRILKRLEYNDADDDETNERDPEIAGNNNNSQGKNEEKDLETVLIGKLRRVESELINERNMRANLITENQSLKDAHADLQKSKQDADTLIASLERDLERAIAAMPSSTAGSLSLHQGAEDFRLAKEDPETLQNILNNTERASTPAEPGRKPDITVANNDHSVLTIIMAQRDRLRSRCESLEAERDSFKRELQAQVSASESLKSDNAKLYEKVRYLQNFGGGDTAVSTSTSSKHRSNNSSSDRDLDLEALEQRYESSVDPFKQFNKAERQRKLKEMSPMERTVFIVAKNVLSTKEMRTGLFFYMLTLHLLVFVTTYHWSHVGSDCSFHSNSEHLSHLPPALPFHIQDIMKAEDARYDGT